MELPSEQPINPSLRHFIEEYHQGVGNRFQWKGVLEEDSGRGYFRYQFLWSNGPVEDVDAFLTPEGRWIAVRENRDFKDVSWSSDERLIIIRKQTNDGPILGIQIRKLRPGLQQMLVSKPPYYDPQFWFSEERPDGNYTYHTQVDMQGNIDGAYLQLEPHLEADRASPLYWRMPIIISFKKHNLEFLVPEEGGSSFKLYKTISVGEEVSLKSFSYTVTKFDQDGLEVEAKELNGDSVRRLTISPLQKINVETLFNRINSKDDRWRELFDQIPINLEIIRKIPQGKS